MPYYKFEDFKMACESNKQDVFPINPVLDDARRIFNLHTKAELLAFIANDGLEELKFVNTKPWENNPSKDQEILVDGYEFRTLNMLGYIAFMYNSKTSKWLIKSFHLSENRNTMMSSALQRAGLIELEDKNE